MLNYGCNFQNIVVLCYILVHMSARATSVTATYGKKKYLIRW